MAGHPPFVRTGSVSLNGVRLGKPSASGFNTPLVGVTGVDFDRDEFDALLADKGYEVQWEKSAFCPNRPANSVHPLAHDVNCKICDGREFVYFGSTCTQMLIQAVKLNQQFWSQGRWDTGMVIVTARPGFALGYWDRITIQNGYARFTELVRRQPSGNDFLKYTPLAIEYVAWVNRQGVLQQFDLDQDINTVSGGTLVWGQNRPDVDTYYTISYRYRPRYVVQDLLHQHRESTIEGQHYEFPTQAVARADFLVRDESRDQPTVQDVSPFR